MEHNQDLGGRIYCRMAVKNSSWIFCTSRFKPIPSFGGIPVKTYVYVDGFNLYYRALKGTPFRWLNLDSATRRLVNAGDDIEVIRYFTARVSARAGDPDAPRRQQILLNAMATLPNIRFHYGKFLSKKKKRPLAENPKKYVEILDTEEKGSDVNLAVHLLHDGWKGRYDMALVMSQDTDLIEPLRLAKTELRKTVGLIWLDGRRPDQNMVAASTFVRHLTKADLAAAQFPNPIRKPDGTEIIKPASW
jgi:uncharacterized LabA/DUF88 family protein